MSINRNNYESYLIDYLDGTLHPFQVAEVLLFLDQNNDIKEEFDNLNSAVLLNTETYFDSSFLLKSEQDRNQLLLIKEIESDLSNLEAIELQNAIKQNPKLVVAQELITLTVQQPDYSLEYPNKKELKRTNLSIVWYTPLVRIASVLVLLSVIGFIYVKLTKQQQPITNNKQNTNQNTNAPIADEQTKLASTKALRPKVIYNVTAQLGGNKVVVINKVVAYAEKVSAIKPHLITIHLTGYSNQQVSASKLSFVKQKEQVQQDQFNEIKSLLVRKLRQNTNQLIGEADTNKQITLVGLINKTTGIDLKIDNDTTSGRINHFELAALGLSWSKK